MKLPDFAVENAVLSQRCGQRVVKWDILQVRNGLKARLRFIAKNSAWRQGVWLKTNKGISIDGEDYTSIVLWEDTAPGTTELTVMTDDGKLHLYKVWDRGRGMESQAYTSGMLVEYGAGALRYRCHDFGNTPDFSKLLFEIELDSD